MAIIWKMAAWPSGARESTNTAIEYRIEPRWGNYGKTKSGYVLSINGHNGGGAVLLSEAKILAESHNKASRKVAS